MNTIIPDIDTLKKVVKLNASIPPEAISPYIDDAIDIYIEPQVGQRLITKALEATDPVLNDKILRCLGPLTLMLATPELGIQFGDSGITVSNEQGKRSPANEAKIAAARENLCFRGMQALDRLLTYLERNAETYPEYAKHLEQTTGSARCFIRNAQEYQDNGLVNIDYSTISYRTMLPTIRQLQERNIQEMLGEELYKRVLDAHLTNLVEIKQKVLTEHIVRYLANKTAELYTSQTSRDQRSVSDTPEFKPIIRPIYQDLTETGNYFANQASYYAGKIRNYIVENAAELGITVPDVALNFNSKDKKIFTSIP